jgi:hypothetical protein
MLVRGGMATIAVLALMLAPAGSSAAPRDVAATHTLVTAGYALARIGAAKIRPAEANARRVIGKFARECPGAGAGSPQNEESQLMSLEAAGALWSAAYGTGAKEIRAFVRTVKPLRWSDPKLTRRVQSLARSLRLLGTLPMPDLCGDVAKWRATGYTKVPASTVSYDKIVEQTEVHTLPERLLRRYERGNDHALALGIERFEAKLEHAEIEVGFEYWNTLLEKLGLNQ